MVIYQAALNGIPRIIMKLQILMGANSIQKISENHTAYLQSKAKFYIYVSDDNYCSIQYLWTNH